MKRESCASWFKNAKIMRKLSAVNNIYSPIIKAHRDRVLVAGDVGATMELEIPGAMISGWKAGQAITTAVQEGNLGLEVTALSPSMLTGGRRPISTITMLKLSLKCLPFPMP